ncbi:MAG: hypothetical protein V4615_12375 [Bacteroidota bacterium]
MSTFLAPKRVYNFSDARLIELGLEKIVFARRDETELLTLGVTAEWVDDFETQILAFGAMPTDTIELGEQKEATDEKELDADQLLDKLKELRSAAKRALGEKSSAYGKFGFKEIDKFKERDVAYLALVIPALTTKHAVVLATKGWDVADNTELGNMLTAFATSKGNQNIEIGSRDTATENRIVEGNVIFNMLGNELCEAGKDYWRTRSEAKHNDYEIFNTASGTSGITVVVEGNYAISETVTADITGVNSNPESTVTIEAEESPAGFFASETSAGLPTGTRYDRTEGSSITMLVDDFKVLIGWSPTKQVIRVQNIGMVAGSYKLTFNNLSE